MKNPLVFLDVSIDGDPAEKMVFELFTDAAPKIAENFRALCTGEKGNSPNTGRHLHYKGSFFHRIVKGLIAQGGDFLNRDGSFGESIYGEKFPAPVNAIATILAANDQGVVALSSADKGYEPISKLKHDERGLLTMAVADRDERCSLFSITFKPLHQLDRKHLVFGKLVQGSEVLEKIDNVGEEDGTPSVAVKIINCGEFFAEKKSKGKRKKSSRRRRKRRRKYYSSDSETSLDSDTESSDSDSDSDSESSYLSSSSDDKHRKRKRSSKRDKYKRGKKRSKRHEKKHRKRDRKSKHRSKRANDSETDSDTQSEGSAGGDAEVNGINQNHKPQAEMIPRNQPSLTDIAAPVQPEKSTINNLFEKEAKFPMENGARQSNKIDPEANSGKAASNILNDHPRKSRSRSLSPKRSRSKSMSISHEKSPSPRQSVKSPNFTKSPQIISQRSRSISKGLPSSPSRSPENGINKRKISRSPIKSSRISVSPSRRRISRSPIRAHARRSYSRSLSKSPENGSPKRIRRGRGFSQRFSYARRYKTPSPDRSPVRSYRYGRNDRERYRRSPRYNRSPPRERTPLRYGNRKSRTRSPVSRSPSPYRAEMRTPPSRSRSPLVTKASPSLKRAHNKDRSSLSSSGSPPISNNNKGLVSYGERSLDAD